MTNSGMSDRLVTSGQGAPRLEDENIIRLFVKGEKTFRFSQKLQIEPQINVITLKSRQGQILGVIKLDAKTKFALVKDKNEYLELIHNILTENNFAGIGDSKKQPGFIEYQQYDVPTGYRINYTTVKILWKTWWPSQRFSSRHNINLNILLLLQEKWYPIKEIIVHEGTFTIKTLVKEITLTSTEKVIWINKVNHSTENSNIPVEERGKVIQNVIANRGTSNEREIETNSIGSQVSPEKDELFKQLNYIEESLKQMNMAYQNEIIALQRKHAEEVNHLWQQMLALHQKISQVETRKVEETTTLSTIEGVGSRE